jgi:serine/threonine-protein kinase
MQEVSSLLAGRYQLGELIGRGGMGEVRRGRDLQSGRPVAVKMLAPQVAQVAARERFAREVRAAARIIHSNVVTILDVGEHQGQPFLVMELLSGRSLAAELVERSQYGIVEACDLMSQAAAGLEAAHRAGVVHRDVKPANLHRTAQGVLKVIDFGVAHVASEAARLTAVGTVVGTAAYLAPEQIGGLGGEPASDLYALGCVCYELLCGHPPFIGSMPELIYQHLHQPPVPPSRHRADIPGELEGLILALLAKDPANRPARAEIARQVLSAVTQSTAARGGRPASSSIPPAPPVEGARAGDTALLNGPVGGLPPAPSSEGRRLLVQVGVAVAAIAAVVLGVALFSGSGQPSAGPAQSGASSVAASDQATPSVAASLTPTPSTLPTSRGWQGWLADFDLAVSAQQAQGGIEPDLARKVHQKIMEAERNLLEGKGKGNQAQKQIAELVRDLAKAQREGKLAADGPLSIFLNRSDLSEDGRSHDGDAD